MITPENTKLLQSLGTSAYAHALQEYLEQECERLNDVSACKDWEDTLGRKHAVEALKKIFSFLNIKTKEKKVANNYE